MRSLQRLPEEIFSVLVLFFYTGGILPFISGGHPAAPLAMALPHFAMGVTLVLLCLHWQRTITTLVRAPLLWLLIGVVMLSPFWSNTPGETWGEIVPLLRITLFSLYLAARYSFKEILQLMGWAMGIAAGLSLLFGALLPSYGVMGRGYIGQSQDWTHEGSWRGIYVHKVVLGSMMSLSILLSFYLASWKNALRPLALVALPMAAIALVMSTTKAALGALVAVFLCIPVYRAFRWKTKYLATFLSIGLPAMGALLAVVVGNADSLFQAIGKDTTLSGRTEIWPLVIKNISQRPWFGYGYDSFWQNGWEGPAANVWVYLPRGFEPPHAHNGFLDILLSFGLVGFAIFLLNVIIFSWQAIRWARAHPGSEGLVPLLLLTFMVLVNITETLWMTSDIFWLCFATTSLAIARKTQRQTYYELYPAIETSEETSESQAYGQQTLAPQASPAFYLD